MKLVEVLAVPVRYSGVTHAPGTQFEMQDGHVNENLVKVIGDVPDKHQQDGPFAGMSIDELKAYAEEHQIDIGKATTEDGIIKKIEEAQKKSGV